MGFNCGIVGLPNVGKSTLFNALTQTAAAQAANFPFCTIEPNIGKVAVPDARIDTIAKIANSQKVIPAQLEFVDIAGVSKGKGFQGVVKRHGFGGVGQATHGQHNRLRAPGSIGAASYPARVFKGMKMAGRMGGDTVKVENLRVLKVVSDKNLLVVKGCVPGHKNSYVIIRK